MNSFLINNKKKIFLYINLRFDKILKGAIFGARRRLTFSMLRHRINNRLYEIFLGFGFIGFRRAGLLVYQKDFAGSSKRNNFCSIELF